MFGDHFSLVKFKLDCHAVTLVKTILEGVNLYVCPEETTWLSQVLSHSFGVLFVKQKERTSHLQIIGKKEFKELGECIEKYLHTFSLMLKEII